MSYRTSTLSEAALLYAKGQNLTKLERGEDNRAWFIFEGKYVCEQLVNAFYNKQVMVNAKDYADAYRTLKDLVFNKDI